MIRFSQMLIIAILIPIIGFFLHADLWLLIALPIAYIIFHILLNKYIDKYCQNLYILDLFCYLNQDHLMSKKILAVKKGNHQEIFDIYDRIIEENQNNKLVYLAFSYERFHTFQSLRIR